MATRLAKIESMKMGSVRFIEDNPMTAEEMTKLSVVMSARESNDIEGISTENSRIFRLLNGCVRPKGHDEYELLGYRDALSKIQNHQDMSPPTGPLNIGCIMDDGRTSDGMQER